MEQGHEGLRPEITRPEWALSITCIVLTVLTLATFLIAGRGDDGKATTKATETSESARPATSNAARSKPAPSAEKAPSSPELPIAPAEAPSPVADPVAPPAVAAAAPIRPTLPTLLVDVAPHGYVELESGAGPSGAFDLEAFASASRHPGEDRAVLSQNGFRRGFVRSWEKPGTTGPSRLVASVFEFGDPIGARALADYETFRVAKEDAGVAFPVDGGSGLRFVHREGAQTVHGYSITLHRDDGLLFYFGALYSAPQPPDEVLLVARSQLERLRLHESAALGG